MVVEFILYLVIDSGVDGLKRLRVTPKLFDRFVDASRGS